MYKIILTKKAQKHIVNLKASGLYDKAKRIRNSLRENSKPFNSKNLNYDLKGKRSIRINVQHRIVYEIFEDQKTIKILSMWSHYRD